MRRLLCVLPLVAAFALAQELPLSVGPTATGFQLPNGWHLTPAGTHCTMSDLPLNIVPLRDGRRALVATSGYNKHELLTIDISGDSPQVVERAESRQSWFGLAVDPSHSRVWWSGGGFGTHHCFDLAGLKRTSAVDADLAKLVPPAPAEGEETTKRAFSSGIAVDASRGVLYRLDINGGRLLAEPLAGGAAKVMAIGGRPYDVVVGPHLIYVSDWAGRRVVAVDPASLQIAARIAVGEHPNQMAVHPKGGRLFVACASTNAVHVIDTKRGAVTEVISTALFPRAPEGSTPDALCVSPDGEWLYVANADNNCVAMIEVEDPGHSIVKGFIPTGWYPTAVAVTPDGKKLLVGVGKGLQTKANPLPPGKAAVPGKMPKAKAKADPDDTGDAPEGGRRLPFPYIGTTLAGALSVVAKPDAEQLKKYTDQVYRNCPYSDGQLTAAPHPEVTAIPTKVGDASPIKHVIYIIKENRTYDQVFGDVPRGNSDPALCMFPRKITPNHHKLADEFVLLDNLFCNGQVSRDGHPWSTMAYHTDYIARDWHLTYSKRKGVDDDDEGNLQNAPSGFIWDAAARVGLSYRNYGEYGKRVSDGQGGLKFEGRVPGLVGHMAPGYGVPPKKGQALRDSDRAEQFLAEFRQFEKDGTLPRLIVMSLPEDHTTGTKVGTFTPQACVASNDAALGRIVEAVSQSRYWKETAIFVIEDDAQNGPDHVDAHRTVGLVISPYCKRQHVDRTQYSTVSMIRTMGLILGFPPLSQYDAAARPMFGSFTATADLTPYRSVPAEIDLNTKNGPNAYGADRSAKMDFSDVDRVDDFELNDVLWHAVMGVNSAQPPAVRRAIPFRAVRTSEGR